MKSLTSVLCLAIVFLLPIGSKGSLGFDGGELTRNIKGQGSGSFSATSIDTNGDGIPASIGTLKGNLSPFGPFSAQAVIEGIITNVPCTAQSGGPGVEETLAQGSEVYRIDSSGDLIFTKVTSLTVCLPTNPNDLSFSFTFEETITGGTGKFASASGSNTVTGTGVLVGQSGTLVAITGSYKGTIKR